MGYEVKNIYRMTIKHSWAPKVEKVINGAHYVYFYRPSRDCAPVVLRKP